MTNESDVKLRSCPFCGGGAVLYYRQEYVEKEGCYCNNKDCGIALRVMPIKQWSTRATDHLLELAAEALRFYTRTELNDAILEPYAGFNPSSKAKAALLTLQQHLGKE